MSLHGDGNVNLKSLCGTVYHTGRSKKTRNFSRKSLHVERLENWAAVKVGKNLHTQWSDYN